MTLDTLLLETISNGLKRKAITRPSKWAETYRVMGPPFPGKWRFDHHPWLLEMHDAEESILIGQKAAQMGYTEWAMNIAFYSMDVLGQDVLYILPSSDDATDFSSGRFDPALELSPHLRDFFADVNNVGLKRAGTSILYVRGSRSRSKLKSIPTPVIIYDEVDEMDQRNIALSEERQSGQVHTKTLKLSTPTLDDFGINADYKLSTQEHFFFKCPHCNRFIELTFPDAMVVTGEKITDPNVKNSYYKCPKCHKKLDHEAKKEFLRHRDRGGTAHFVAQNPNGYGRGFHVNQMYSMTLPPDRFAFAYLKSLTDPTYEQEFYNSKLARVHTVEGAKVTDEQINEAIRPYQKGSTGPNTLTTMGVDVGVVLHMIILEWELEEHVPGVQINDLASCRLIYEGKSSGGPNDFDEAYEIFNHYFCNAVVIDAEPERREATRFARRLYGRALTCDYLWSQSGKEATIQETTIKVNRTAWMDQALGRFRNKTIALPVDVSQEYRSHIKEPVRVFREDKWGNKYGVYVNVKADHYAHAQTYAEIALPLAVSLATSQDLTNVY